jgi:hypothetical protein
MFVFCLVFLFRCVGQPQPGAWWFPSPLRDPTTHPISRLARHRLGFGGAAAAGGSIHERKSMVDRYQ